MVKKSIGAQITLFIFSASIFFGAIFLKLDFGNSFLNTAYKLIKPYLFTLSFLFTVPLIITLILQIWGKETEQEDKEYYNVLKSLFYLCSLLIFSLVLALISAFVYIQLIKWNPESLSLMFSIILYCLIVYLIWKWFKKYEINMFNFIQYIWKRHN